MESFLFLTQFLSLLLFPLHLPFASSSPSLSSSLETVCPHDQSHALLLFKSSFSINTSASFNCSSSYYECYFAPPYPKTESWKEGTDCCSWYGVTCDLETGNVIGLDLSSSMLYGSFPSHNNSLFLLSHLQKLDLSNNDFVGSNISSKFGQLLHLTHLNLNSSNFEGIVPSEISHLSNLVSLDLSRNFDLKLDSSSFSNIVQNLTKLRELTLKGFDMSMVTPSSFMNFSSSLSSLNLQECDLPSKFLQYVNLPSGLLSLDLSFTDLILDTAGFVKLVQNLTKLKEFDLSFVNLSLVAPTSFMNLSSSLTSLRLNKCQLQGKFPNNIHLPELVSLDLSYNSNLAIEKMAFHNLREVDLSYVDLSFMTPSFLMNLSSSLSSLHLFHCGLRREFQGNSFSNLTQLKILVLSFNNLKGQISPSFGNLQQLTRLDLSSNNLDGQIPPSFGNLQQLISLDLSSNSLSGGIPSSFTNLKQLTSLNLNNNSLSGPLPTYFSSFTQLQDLDLSNNLFNATIPFSLFTLSQLEYLDLKNNQLNGPLSQFRSESLYYIDLSNNNLHGSIPSSIFNQMGLAFLILSSNHKLNGSLSSSICKLKFLNILDLSNNSLTGFIPQCLGNFSDSLSVLHLGFNNFGGTVPVIFSKGTSLRYLNFKGNQLQGRIPASIVNCRNLEVLDVSNNKIDDVFPIFLGGLPNLQILVLQSNKLHGPLTLSFGNFSFPNLRIFDLSNNTFSGSLPEECFNGFRAMMNFTQDSKYMKTENISNYYYSVGLTLKDLDTDLVKIQTAFSSIDLSLNKFTGEIPKSIGKLKMLKLLNLSHNYLTGNIKPSLGNLTSLESLDLSSNLLTGKIPMQLMELTFLEVFHVSNNKLEGQIPHGKQFNTFENDSYEGNLGLCGFPLSKECENNSTQDVKQWNIQERDNWGFVNGFGWNAVLTGYGCGLVLGFSLGYIVFTTRKPKWFVKKVESAWDKKSKKSRKKCSRPNGIRN